MNRPLKQIVALLALACRLLAAHSPSSMNYHLFENFLLSREALSVRCFIQDKQGMMWIGTDKGLFSYDGFRPYPHFTYADSMNLPVNCALLYGDDRLLLGTQKGVRVYNYKHDAYEPFPLALKDEVQALALDGADLWIGAMSGLFRYDMQTRLCRPVTLDAEQVKLQPMVYSVLADGESIYVGSNLYFGRYEPHTGRFERILPSQRQGIVFANTLLKDSVRKCIWVGTSNFLAKYVPESRTVELEGDFPFIKAMSLDRENNVVIGTDNGLCVCNETGTQHIRHDSRDDKSLANNIVWAAYTDLAGNVWLGTDYGVSRAPNNRNFEYIPIHQLTRSPDGNHVYSILKDARGYYWLGGTSGLIRADGLHPQSASRWYMMNHPQWNIAHNRIRHIFEDRNNQLWALSDGGLNRYRQDTGQFTYHVVADSSGTYHSGWTYYMMEDNRGDVWIATCMSGILVADRQSLQNAPFTIARKCFNTSNGLAGNFVTQVVADQQAMVWALVYDTGLDRIDPHTNRVTHIAMPREAGGAKPALMLRDAEGFLWVSFRGGATKINTATLQMQTVGFDGFPLAMTEVDGYVWISSTGGVWMVNKNEQTLHHLNTLGRTFTGLYYDAGENSVCLGGIDELAVAKPSLPDENGEEAPIVLTALQVAGGPSLPSANYRGKSIRYLDNIRLPSRQNTFTLAFSDLNFSQEQAGSFAYKLSPGDEGFQVLNAQENTISFSNLKAGKYSLQIGRLGVNRLPSAGVRTFGVEILQPWYFTPPAKGFYAVLLLCLTLWTLYFFRLRNRLRFECMEKEKTIEQSKLKMDFFTEISHEFKTPLSLIVALASRLPVESKGSAEDKKKFQLIYRNAMKLSSLIHQALDFYRDDNRNSVGLITSHIEFIGFARELFASCTEKMKDKAVECIFASTVGKIYLDVDVVKIESALNNLLSNACKYTRENDSIMMSVDYLAAEEALEIKVYDTGIGIPRQDLPYVFQRFFQSPTHAASKEGTGIGLYMAKKYVELHGGQIQAASDEGGTSFAIRLPVAKLSVAEGALPETEYPGAGSDRPLVLVVEDNNDLADFICSLFAPEYRCVAAHNGKVGLKLCIELLPDLVIADVMMPVMDGLEMCRRIKAHLPTSTIPIVLLTAKDGQPTELHSLRLQIEAFIPKPFDVSILSLRVKQLIDSKKQIEKKLRIEILTEPRLTEDTGVSYAEKLLANVTRVIEERLSEPDFNVDMLCDIVGVSQKQVYRKIKELTGMTVIEYIKSIKLKKAALLLESRKFTVSEVMYMVGFSNHSYFAKCFSARFGVHPNRYGAK
jgi:signal transduction histidine kinase/ligand-binding sensor domain-containing protein/DNA-binding response OmpR family regulator